MLLVYGNASVAWTFEAFSNSREEAVRITVFASVVSINCLIFKFDRATSCGNSGCN